MDNNQDNNNIDDQQEGEEDHFDDQENAIISKNWSISQRLQKQSQYQQQNESEFEVTNSDSMQNTQFNPEIFIELIRMYPCIWNTKLNVYRDQQILYNRSCVIMSKRRIRLSTTQRAQRHIGCYDR